MWRNTMLPVRLYIVDARALLPAGIFFLHWSWLTFYIALVGIAFFAVLEWCGLTPPIAWRIIRRWIIGRRRPAIPAWKRRRFA